MDCSTPGFPVHHQLPEFTQTHVHWVSDAIQPSHPLCLLLFLPSIFPSIRVFSNESALPSGGQSIGVSASTSVLPMNIQDWFPLGWTGWISLQSKGLSRVFSNTTVQKAMLNGLLYCSKLFWTPLVQVEKPHLWKQKSSHRLRVSHSTQDGHTMCFQIYLPWTQKLPDLVPISAPSWVSVSFFSLFLSQPSLLPLSNHHDGQHSQERFTFCILLEKNWHLSFLPEFWSSKTGLTLINYPSWGQSNVASS